MKREYGHWKSGVLFLAVALVAAVGCRQEEDLVEKETPVVGGETEVGEATPSVEEIKEDTMAYIGEEVMLTGEVGEVHSDRSFQLEGNDWIFDAEVLVVTRSPMTFGAGALSDDDQVIVKGTVRRMVVADLERELGWDLDPELEAEYRDKTILVAESVRQVMDQAVWTQGQI